MKATDHELRSPSVRGGEHATLKGENTTGSATGAQPLGIRALALRILERNSQRNHGATEDTMKRNSPRNLHDAAELLPARVFSYRLDGAGAWLILLTTDATDTLETLPDRLAQRFGCQVEVRMRGKP